jgi:hypothetical protein
MMLFFADVRVKENRKTLVCKKSGGDSEICEIEEPPSKAPHMGRRRRR